MQPAATPPDQIRRSCRPRHASRSRGSDRSPEGRLALPQRETATQLGGVGSACRGWVVALFPVLVIIVIMVLVVVYFARHPDSASRARFLKRAGFGLMAFVTAVFALFVVGETVDDPGGWAAAGLIAPWLAPAGLAALYWYRPSLAGRVLIGLTMMLVAVTVWATADSDSWRAFEDHHGPVRTIAVFVLTAAVPCWG